MSEFADFGKEKIVLVSLNVSVKNLNEGKPYLGKETILKCMQKYWKLDPSRANQADYVIGICRNEVICVAKIVKRWKNVILALQEGYFSDCPELETELKRCIENGEPYCEPNFPNLNLLERYACVGEIVEDSHPLAKQIGKKVPNEYRFYGNVVRFVNI